MYARTNTGSTHGDFQDRNGVNYVTSTESFGHCSQLFWKKDPNDSGPSSTISWCDQLPTSSAALSSSSLSSASLSSSSLSLESRAPPPPPPAVTAPDDMDSDERPYVCDLCTCAYKHASSLLNHKLTHKIGDFRCDFCSKPYTNYMSLRNHMRIHGQKRYMCDLCGKAFRLARYLRNHQRIHDDGPNRFDCPSCCKSYRTMLELAQ
uniref:C2H2-type domain-containing protein n=2 Tax=Gasterosteus aculeatus TaxID=69293 RepID=G3NNX6_GASAC